MRRYGSFEALSRRLRSKPYIRLPPGRRRPCQIPQPRASHCRGLSPRHAGIQKVFSSCNIFVVSLDDADTGRSLVPWKVYVSMTKLAKECADGILRSTTRTEDWYSELLGSSGGVVPGTQLMQESFGFSPNSVIVGFRHMLSLSVRN